MTVNGDNSGATVTDDCLISSMTRLEASRQAAGSLTATADLYRGARTTSIVRNTAPAGQALTVTGLCGSFYRVRLPESFDFNDTLNGQMTAYVQKNKVRIPVTSVAIPNADSIRSLKVGQEIKASSSCLPDLATEKELAWKSSDTGVAAVENDGSITAKKAGTAVITLTEKNSRKQTAVTITVSDVLATSLRITNTKELKNLSVGSTTTAKATVTPGNTSKKKLIWKSSNPRVASVDQNGTIRVLAGGSATITVIEQYSGLTASTAIGAGYSLGAPKGKSQPKLRLKKSTDFRGNTITWNRISGAKYYRVHVEHWDKTKKKYIRVYKNGKKVKKTAYYDRDVAKNQKCRYCVVAIRRKKQSPDRRKEKSKKSHRKSHGTRPIRHRGTAGEAEARLEKRLHQKPERDPGLQNLPRHRGKREPPPPEIHPHLDRHQTPGRDILLLPDPCLRETEKENRHRGIQRHKGRSHHIRKDKLELLQ